MNGTGVITVVLTLLTVRVGAFVTPPQAVAIDGIDGIDGVDASCVSRAVCRRRGGTGSALAELGSSQRRCRRERQQQQQQQQMVLRSSRRHEQTSQQRQRRRFGRAGSAHLFARPTATMNMRLGARTGEGEDELELRRKPPRIPREQQQQQQRQSQGHGQQSRADFLRAGASLAGLTATVLGAQQQAAQAIDLGGVEFGFQDKNKFNIPPEDNPDGLRSPRPLAYRVMYTDPPTTVPFPREFEPNLVKEISGQPLVFFGVHGEDERDQALAAEVMGKLSAKVKDKAAIGLEQVEMQFQPALDAYLAGQGEDLATADAVLAEATQWGDRCAFPFENFLPVFHLARSRGLPLLAMGVDSEKVFDVMQNGMDSLGADDRNAYVSDFKGFVTYVRDKGFQTYADKLIFPSYDRLNEAGLLGKKPPTKPNFFAARILADEALASKAVDWATQNSGKRLFVVQREDHVKFGFGASGRAARIAQSLGNEMSTKSVLINPTAEDSLSLSRSLRLALEYADDLQNGKPLADYLWFSKSPKVNQIPRMVNPEDKGWLESINLYDLKGAAPG
eukprot:g18674.t1